MTQSGYTRSDSGLVPLTAVGVVYKPDDSQITSGINIATLAAGGTNLENSLPFLEAGCVGIGLGAALCDPALAAAGRYDEIERRARAFADRVATPAATGRA